MAMPANPESFDKFVDEDIAWLRENAPDVFYRNHIEKCLQMAKTHYRNSVYPNIPDSEWDC